MAEDWVPQLAQRTTAPIHQDRQTVRGRAAGDLFLSRGRPGHGEFRRSDGPILNPCQLEAHGSQVGPLGRRSLQQLAARTALSGTNRVFYCRAGYCTRPPRSPPVGRGRHQRTQRPLPLRPPQGCSLGWGGRGGPPLPLGASTPAPPRAPNVPWPAHTSGWGRGVELSHQPVGATRCARAARAHEPCMHGPL